MARLNKHIDIHFKTHYKVVDYNVKQPQTRVPEITPTPYGYSKWVRKQRARRICITTQGPHHTLYTLDRSKNYHKETVYVTIILVKAQ